MIHGIFTDLYNREIVKKRCQGGVLIYNKNESKYRQPRIPIIRKKHLFVAKKLRTF